MGKRHISINKRMYTDRKYIDPVNLTTQTILEILHSFV